MSKVFIISNTDDNKIELLKVFSEGNETSAYKLAKKTTGAASPDMDVKSFIKAGNVYQVVVFKNKERVVACLSSSKVLNLNKNDVINSIKKIFPDDAVKYISSVFSKSGSKNKEQSNEEQEESSSNQKKESIARFIKKVYIN